MNKILLFSFFLGSFYAIAQSPFKLIISPKVESSGFALNEVVTDKNGKKMEIDHFAYYISKVHLIHDGGQDLDLSDTVFLVKHDNHILDLGILDITDVEKITFGIGVPYELSHTDISLYPHDHPLSFQSPSMQWGWAAGYMHMIVGGLADADQNDVPDTYFEIHNLGDNNYYEIEIPVSQVNGEDLIKSIYLDCNLDEWIGTTDLAANGIQHGETGVNYNVMKNIILRPVFTATANAGLHEINKIGEIIFYKNTSGNFLKWSGLLDLESLQVMDMNGKKVQEKRVQHSQNELNLGEIKPGTYFVRFFDKNNSLLNYIKIAL